MCRALTCRACGKATWSGCGRHVEQVLAGVPRSERCAGHPAQAGVNRGWLSRLLGR